jgi:hypothetical protein
MRYFSILITLAILLGALNVDAQPKKEVRPPLPEIPFADARMSKLKLGMRQAEVERLLGAKLPLKENFAYVMRYAADGTELTDLPRSALMLNANKRVIMLAGPVTMLNEAAAIDWLMQFGTPIRLTAASTIFLPSPRGEQVRQYGICVNQHISLTVSILRYISEAQDRRPEVSTRVHTGASGCAQAVR